jgi:hypothetical protein
MMLISLKSPSAGSDRKGRQQCNVLAGMIELWHTAGLSVFGERSSNNGRFLEASWA